MQKKWGKEDKGRGREKRKKSRRDRPLKKTTQPTVEKPYMTIRLSQPLRIKTWGDNRKIKKRPVERVILQTRDAINAKKKNSLKTSEAAKRGKKLRK